MPGASFGGGSSKRNSSPFMQVRVRENFCQSKLSFGQNRRSALRIRCPEFLWLYFYNSLARPQSLCCYWKHATPGFTLEYLRKYRAPTITFRDSFQSVLRHSVYYFSWPIILMASGSDHAVYDGDPPEDQHNEGSQPSSDQPPHDPSLQNYRLSQFVDGPNSTPVPSDHTPQEVEESHRNNTSETLSAIQANLP
ncbi:hypothetical protein F4775DRAFT_181635 [Biscogniauxia sp. FL1348]|nr:hypothetical protein F4775DRAFT_181635 [Biscogniauxia sp. FL1348]